MNSLSIDMKRAGNHQERRRELATIFTEEQANIAKEQQIITILNRARRIDKSRRIRQRQSSAIKIQWGFRRFMRSLKNRKMCTIQKWWVGVLTKRESETNIELIRAAVVLRRAVLLRRFIVHWHRSRNVALKVQKLFRFRVWYFQELLKIDEGKRIARTLVSNALLSALNVCLRNVVEKNNAIIVQRHWKNFMYRPVDIDTAGKSLKSSILPTTAELQR